MKKITIALDFDGTCVIAKDFPAFAENPGAVEVLRALVANGHKLILNTMRSNVQSPQSDDAAIKNVSGNHLDEAIKWFADNDIKLYAIGKDPRQHHWTSSDKCYAPLMIDDSCLFAPKIIFTPISDKPAINWLVTYKELCKLDLLEMNNELLIDLMAKVTAARFY